MIVTATISSFVPMSVLATKTAPADLPFAKKVDSPIIFVGEIISVTWDLPLRGTQKPDLPIHSRSLMVVIRPIRTIKNPKGKLVKDIFVSLPSNFPDAPVPASWTSAEESYVGRSLIFFGSQIVAIEPDGLLMVTGTERRPEPLEREREVMASLKAKN